MIAEVEATKLQAAFVQTIDPTIIVDVTDDDDEAHHHHNELPELED